MNIEDLETNAITRMLEEKFNVDFEFQLYPANEALEKFAVIASSGGELPDVVNLQLTNSLAYRYGQRGILIPLNDYWENPALTQNFDSVCTDPELKEDILNAVTMPDGNIYCLPTYSEFAWNQMCYRFWINQAWLDALGLSIPTTTDEFKAVLQAFATDDPNGNGIQDEIPLMGATGWAQSILPFLMGSFVEVNADSGYFTVSDGQVNASFTEPAFQEALTYIASLFSEGLIYPASFTQDQTQFRAIINNDGDYAIGVVAARSTGNWADYQTNPNFAVMTLLAPLTGPDGVCCAAYSTPSIFSKLYITSDCENPELAFRVFEYCYNQFFKQSDRHGVYGVNWTDDPEILAQYIGNYESIGIMPQIAVIDDVWSKQQNVHWNASLPIFEDSAMSMGEASILRDTDEDVVVPYWYADHYECYASHKPAEPLPSLIYTDDEMDRLTIVKTAVDDYRDESILAFVTGNKSLEEWDGYVAELNKIGLEEYLEIMQTAYDRTK